MGIYVEIKKYAKDEDKYYYIVNAKDIQKITFYIAIDPTNKRVFFYKTDNFACHDGIVDFANSTWSTISGIHSSIIHKVLTTAREAMQKNTFPEDISYCA